VVPPETLAGLRGRLKCLLRTRSTDDAGRRDSRVEPVFPTLAVFADVSDVFEHALEDRRPAVPSSAAYVVAECHRLVLESGESPPDMEALCRRLGISRRTLQYSFRRIADLSPLQYLRSLRLNVVRQRLRETNPEELAISQAAAAQGFEQMSHFAERFRELFGELPSRALRAREDAGRLSAERLKHRYSPPSTHSSR
jgi:AraC-like DNA-binding protein